MLQVTDDFQVVFFFNSRSFTYFVTRVLYEDSHLQSQQQALIDMMYRTKKTFESTEVREVEISSHAFYEGGVLERAFCGSSLELLFAYFSTSQQNYFGVYVRFTTGFLRVRALFFGLRLLRDGVHFLLLAGGIGDSSEAILSSDSKSSESDMSDSDSSAIIRHNF